MSCCDNPQRVDGACVGCGETVAAYVMRLERENAKHEATIERVRALKPPAEELDVPGSCATLVVEPSLVMWDAIEAALTPSASGDQHSSDDVEPE
ncbi:MAG: hypothetical protein ACE5EF_03905 [Dehalococcoidia bacterium]